MTGEEIGSAQGRHRLPKNRSVSGKALWYEGSSWFRGDAKHSCRTPNSSCKTAPDSSVAAAVLFEG